MDKLITDATNHNITITHRPEWVWLVEAVLGGVVVLAVCVLGAAVAYMIYRDS